MAAKFSGLVASLTLPSSVGHADAQGVTIDSQRAMPDGSSESLPLHPRLRSQRRARRHRSGRSGARAGPQAPNASPPSPRRRMEEPLVHPEHVSTVTLRLLDDAVAHLSADVLTMQDRALLLWQKGSEVARFPLDQVVAIELHGLETSGVSDKNYTVAGKRQQHPNAYRPWTQDEEERLLARQEAGLTVKELAVEFGRQPGAIQSRLTRLQDL